MTDPHEDADAVLSVRADDAPVEIEGSKRRPCRECGEDVIVSPASVRSIEEGIYPEEFVCLVCFGDT